MGSICFLIDGKLFTGDTIMQSKPYINKRNGSKEEFRKSIKKILAGIGENQVIYPGHGEVIMLKDSFSYLML